ANNFAADVMNYLTDRPVDAFPPSTWYRLSKYARRNRAALTTAGLLGLALVAGTAVSVWQAVRATRSEVIARQMASESEAIQRFLVYDLLGASDPEQVLGRDVKVGEVLANAEEKLETAFPEQPLVEGGVRHALGTAYHSLGEYDDALRQFSR